MARAIGGRPLQLISRSTFDGPWPCEQCGQLTQFAECTTDINKIFCKNERCRYQRIVDKRRMIIKENDGSLWRYDMAGNKWRVG